MAERRMFAKTIIDSDMFLDMPASTQCLYFHLSMRADDEGVVNNPKSIRRAVGASQEDYDLLVRTGYVISFDSGIAVIRDWKINNYIQKDRLKQSVYQNEISMLDVDENGSYSVPEPLDTECEQPVYNLDTECEQPVYNLDTQDSIGKNRLDKDSKGESKEGGMGEEKRKRFSPPSLDQVREYCLERGNHVDPEAFYAFYQSNGWKVGKNAMKDWKAAVRTWERRSGDTAPKKANAFHNFEQREYDYDSLEAALIHKDSVAIDAGG